MLKKFVTALTIFALVLSSMLSVHIFAEDDIGYEGRICRDLGILQGDIGVVDSDYLETRPSRLQAAIMFLRLKGLEQDALSYTDGNNFKDAGVIAWKEGRNVLSYLKDHSELGWIGDGVNFLPYSLIDSKAYYKVLLESLGYKQKVEREGDFTWDTVIEFAEEKGLDKVAGTKYFTVRSLAIATVEALQTKMKGENRKLIDYLVDIGEVDREDAISFGLYSRQLDASVKDVRAISNSKVEIIFEEAIDGSDAEDEDLYNIKQLDIKGISIKNTSAVIIDTSSMKDSTTYELVFDNKTYSFRGLKKDSSSPKLIKAESRDTDRIELIFDRVLDNVTAQDTDTYSIEGVDIRSAELDITNTKVRLTTRGFEAGRSYDMKIRNIKNGDGVTTKSITKRITGRKDTSSPKLNKLTVLNNIRLLLEFADSNGLDKMSAMDIDNYRISYSGGSLAIEEAQVKDRDDDGLWDSVELVTESQDTGTKYTLIIKDISDDSVLGNKITREIKKEFRGKAMDKSGPTVANNPRVISNNMVEVEFSDANALDIESACDTDNYEIDEGLDIVEIRIKDPEDLYSTKGRTVIITTSEMEKSESYTLIISYVQDEFGNEMKSSSSAKKYRFKGVAEDRTPPYITSVECIDNNTIKLNFDNMLDEGSAENMYNYRIDGLALVTKAVLQEGDKTVELTVSTLSSDKKHTVLLNNIKDLSGNAISDVSVSLLYNGNLYDDDPPEIESIDAVNENEVWIEFEEEVYAERARMKAGGIDFEQVGSVLEDGTTVVMKASELMDDKEYEVTSLTGIWDLRNNYYELENNLEFYGSDSDNDPPEVDNWDQMDVRRFRVVFTEPVLLIEGKEVAGIKNPSGSGIEWVAVLNPDEEDDNEAYSTVDYVATNKNIPADKEFKFNFTEMVSDYVNLGAYDEDDDYYGDSNSTVMESYIEDDEEPYIEDVEAITRNKVQIVFSEDMREPGRYKITYEDDDNRLRGIDIDLVELDSKDKTRVNIFTEDEMSDEYYYILEPQSSAIDIAGNKLDIDGLEFEFEGSTIMSSDYIQGVEVLNAKTLRVSKSSTIYKVSNLYELDEDGDTLGENLIDSISRVSDNVYKIVSKRPLLKDVRYKITVDGLSYKFYGAVINADLDIELPEREITYDGIDSDEHYVEVYRTNGDELDINEEDGHFKIDNSEFLENGDLLYIYVVRKSDGVVIYGSRIKIEGMHTASSSKEITSFSFNSLGLELYGNISNNDNLIRLSVPYGTDKANLRAIFRCSEYAIVKVGSVVQVSGETKNDFSKEVIYTVIAQDGSEKYYTVLVTTEASKYEKKITSFIFRELDPDVVGIIDYDNHVITIQLQNGTDLRALIPTIETSSETTISPESGIKNDFSKPVIYKVTAKDGSVQDYTVNVNINLSSENSIKSFRFEKVDAYETIITGGNENTVSITVPYNTNVAELTPIITVSDYGSMIPESGVVNDFTDEAAYTVIAQDGSRRNYTVKVNIAKEMDKTIKEFKFEGLDPDGICEIDEETGNISITVPYRTKINGLVPTIIIPDKARVSPESGTAQNFNEPVVYTVTAKDGTTRTYTVYVNRALSSAKMITDFSFPEVIPPTEVSVGGKQKTIELTVPYRTIVSSLKAAFTVSQEATVKVGEVEQVSGETSNDFSESVVYTVIAQDGSTRNYTVKVTAAPSNEKLIKEFGFAAPRITGTIDEAAKSISVKLPYGTDVTNLAAVFKGSDNSTIKVNNNDQKSGESINDFANPVKYTVVAQDGSTQDYTVTVAVADENEKSMTEFVFAGLNPVVKGIIDQQNHIIRTSVPTETNVSNLIASFSFLGKAVYVGEVQQYSGITANDFSREVVFKVIANDDSYIEYTVIVTIGVF